jgi:hypothetical protein
MNRFQRGCRQLNQNYSYYIYDDQDLKTFVKETLLQLDSALSEASSPQAPPIFLVAE